MLFIYLFYNIKYMDMKNKIRSLNLDDETVDKLKRIGELETGTSNISAAVRILAKNYKEKKA